MRLLNRLLYPTPRRQAALLLALTTLFVVSLQSIRCDQLSTVFVLETSDSDSLVSNESSSINNSSDSAGANTRIITDNQENSSSSNNNNNNKKQNNTNNQRSSNITTQQQQQQQAASNNKQVHDQIQNDEATTSGSATRNSSSRRLDEDSFPVQRPKQQQQQQSQQNQPQYNRNKPATSTTSGPYERDRNSSVPKTEERLLISITSEEDDSYDNKPPKVSSSLSGGSTGGGGYNGEEPISGHNQQVHQHQKRKPAITISIQDANINKQNGGSGGSAVILRPGEDGQSIVIATVGTNSNGGNNYKPNIVGNNGGNLHDNNNKPIHIPVTNINGQNNNNNNNNDPYRDPISNPMQGIIQQHQRPIQTTRRPALVPVNEPYRDPLSSNSNINRPIVSTLVDGHRPPQQVGSTSDERPHRPTVGSDDGLSPSSSSLSQYDTTSRPQRPIINNNNNQQPHHDYDTSHRPNDYQNNNNNNGREETGLTSGSEQRKYPLNEKNCGIMHETRIVGGEEADPDDFMWMAAIIKSKPGAGEPRPFCGGSLITRRHILTAAHCLEGLAPRDVLVRLGSYDFEDSASSSSADYAIDQFRVPAQYSKKTHVADLAIMRLKTPLSTNDNYKTVCMPQPRRSYVGALGTVTGYGSQSQTFRRAAPKLRQVTVPIWENRKCSVVYKKNLTESFLCAGYEEGGKDACQGDSGGPLMTEGPEQRMMIVGVVSHGIGCGSPGYPGVYTRTSTFQEWIEKNTSE